MSDISDIAKGIRAIAGTDKMQNMPEVYYAIVEDVDEGARTCSCTLVSGPTEMLLHTVLLMATVNDGFYIIPQKGSTVILQTGQNIMPYIVMFSAIDKVFLVSGDKTFQIDKDGLKLGSDTYGGVPKVKELTEKLNNLENIVNELIANYNSHTHIYAPGTLTPIPTASPIPTEANTITPTQQSDIENKMVQHGDGG